MTALADHVCGDAASSLPKKSLAMNFFDRLAGTANAAPTPKVELVAKPARSMPPPRIDAAAANRPFLQPPQATPMSSYSSNYANSPQTPSHDPKSPAARSYSSFKRNPHGPPSPDMTLGYDNPFPPFPSNSYRDTASTKSPRAREPMSPNPPRNPRLYDNVKADLPLMSPGESVMRRAKSIKPGPFDSRRAFEDNKADTSTESTAGHRRSKTTESVKDIRNRSGQDILRRPSTANSQKDQGSIYSELSKSNPYDDQPPVPELPRAQPAVAQRSMRPTEQIDRFLEQLQSDGTYEPALPPPSPMRSQTDPLPRAPTSNPYFDEPSTLGAGPSAPLPEPPSLRPQASRSRSRTDGRINGAPPVPIMPDIQKQFPGIGAHSPTESASSDGSMFSSHTSQSSRSSPPNSDAGWSRRPSDASNAAPVERDPYTHNRGRSGTVTGRPPPSAPEPPLPQSRERSRTMNGNAPPPFRKPSRDIDESVITDPAVQMADGAFGSSRPPLRPSNTSPTIPTFAANVNASPPRTKPDPVFRPPNRSATEPISALADLRRKPTGTARSPCRGCGALIIGRAIKAADGRLTGRWHKECFTCTTCDSPFPNSDFYVIKDQPYCQLHYHQLNNSLCGTCDTGIEGQYLETDKGKKYHKTCFTCTVCDLPLRDEYYEVKEKQYCERHAWAVAQRNAGLDPNNMGIGGRFRGGGLGTGTGTGMMEKRTTRMLFM
ncbi:hypothetical protein NA57DRAFT_51640 [Rhizodiscina lignyota]|uniref:LIM zinc-binding domain-containing protein n=1 Tax=Rhizodiscina lignyota TaxID=1504668 RepID=A0A9P4INN9_9PEZI|nr:hypothetical protein NA57DRAFT_51640 [Rhizodiscina lignyota]